MRKAWRIRLKAASVAFLFGLAFGEPAGRYVRDGVAWLMTPAPTPAPGMTWTMPAVSGSSSSSSLFVSHGALSIESASPVLSATFTYYASGPASIYTNQGATGPTVVDLSRLELVGLEEQFVVMAAVPMTVRAATSGKIYLTAPNYLGETIMSEGSEWTSSALGSSLTITHIGSGTWVAKRGNLTGSWTHP